MQHALIAIIQLLIVFNVLIKINLPKMENAFKIVQVAAMQMQSDNVYNVNNLVNNVKILKINVFHATIAVNF